MRTAAIVALVATVPLAACDTDPSCSMLDAPPPPPTLSVDSAARSLTWDASPGATSYNLYVKAVENCVTVAGVPATKSDQRFTNVHSPFDVSEFNRCNVCYSVGIAAVNGTCESELLSRLEFGLGPCV